MHLSRIFLFYFFVFIIIAQMQQKALAMPTECDEDMNVCGYSFCDNLSELQKKYQDRYGTDQKYTAWQKQRKWCSSENDSFGILEVKNAEVKKLCHEDSVLCQEEYRIMDGDDCEDITTDLKDELKTICLENNDSEIVKACKNISKHNQIDGDNCRHILRHKNELKRDEIKMKLFELVIKNIRASKDIW